MIKNTKNAEMIDSNKKSNVISYSIMKKIVNSGLISRSNLAKELGVTKTIISKKVNELLNVGFLIEVGKGNNSLGKKEILLDINGKHKNILVIDLSKNRFSFGIYDLKKKEIVYKYMEYPKAEEIGGIFDKIVSDYTDKNLIEVVVFSVPGVVNGLQLDNVKDKKLLDIFEELKKCCYANYFKVKVYNDVELESYGVKNMNKYKEKGNFFVLSCNYGIGGSIIVNDKVYLGENNYAGEVALLNPIINEGTITTFEDRCSIRGMMERYNKDKDKNIKDKELRELIKKGDKTIEKYYQEMYDEFALILFNIACVTDVKKYVLIGDLFTLKLDFLECLNKRMEVLEKLSKPIHIEIPSASCSAIDGAKILALEEIISSTAKNSV
ncbi:MAG: ROK family protein [Lachnospirales bacterium]